MIGICAFCRTTGKLTKEHIFGDWLTRIGLDMDPVAHSAGPLNRIGRRLGESPPFRRTVRDVCAACNNGWMSQLEVVAQRVLKPFILGEPGQIERADLGAVTSWIQKTALTAMLASTVEERASGYGLPQSEYYGLWELRDEARPLPASQFWIGRYNGVSQLASTWVTPLVVTVEGLPHPDMPHAYAVTIVLGQLLLHGVRFTTQNLQVEVTPRSGVQQLWPSAGPVAWPENTPLGDAEFFGLAKAGDLRSTERHIEVRPWKPASQLTASRGVNGMVELPTACGKHVVYYPAILAIQAIHGASFAFITSCDCSYAYLVYLEGDGAYCRVADTAEVVSERYDRVPGQEIVIDDEGGSFFAKRLSGRA